VVLRSSETLTKRGVDRSSGIELDQGVFCEGVQRGFDRYCPETNGRSEQVVLISDLVWTITLVRVDIPSRTSAVKISRDTARIFL